MDNQKKIEEENARLRTMCSAGQFDSLKQSVDKKLTAYKDEIFVLKRRVALIEGEGK